MTHDQPDKPALNAYKDYGDYGKPFRPPPPPSLPPARWKAELASLLKTYGVANVVRADNHRAWLERVQAADSDELEEREPAAPDPHLEGALARIVGLHGDAKVRAALRKLFVAAALGPEEDA